MTIKEYIEKEGIVKFEKKLTIKGKEKVKYPNWIITDVRFSNEVEAIQQKGGVVVRIVRDENTSDKHTSEVALNNYGNFDFIIKNDGTIADLIQKIKEIY